MSSVMLIARVLSALLGVDFEQEFACWTDLTNRDYYTHVCEYRSEFNSNYILVGESADGLTVMVNWK